LLTKACLRGNFGIQNFFSISSLPFAVFLFALYTDLMPVYGIKYHFSFLLNRLKNQQGIITNPNLSLKISGNAFTIKCISFLKILIISNDEITPLICSDWMLCMN